MIFPDKLLDLDEMIDFFQMYGESRRMVVDDPPQQSENSFAVVGWLRELKGRKAQEWILYEDKDIFEGWCAKFKLTGEIEIRKEFQKMIPKDLQDKIRADIIRDLKKIKKSLKGRE